MINQVEKYHLKFGKVTLYLIFYLRTHFILLYFRLGPHSAVLKDYSGSAFTDHSWKI